MPAKKIRYGLPASHNGNHSLRAGLILNPVAAFVVHQEGFEETVQVSVQHRIGLDTGPIVLQKEVEIGPDDTLGSLYFDSLFPLGVAAMLEAVDLVKAGNAPKIPQDPEAGSYEGWCRAEDAQIDWNKPAQQVYNLIRGTNPQPGAWTRYQDQTLKIFDSALSSESGGTPGTVLAIDDDGIRVAAQDGQVLIKRVRPEGDKKIAASEFATKSGLSVGDKLG